jgi:hypothetical protein
MIIHEILVDRKKAALDQIASLEQEVAEINRMLSLSPPQSTVAGPSSIPFPRMRREEQVIEAIKAGCRTPAQITKYLSRAIGEPVNGGTIRTRLSRMKAEGKVSQDGKDWCLPPSEQPMTGEKQDTL